MHELRPASLNKLHTENVNIYRKTNKYLGMTSRNAKLRI